MRQLSRRGARSRQSTNSDGAVFSQTEDGMSSPFDIHRDRSLSGSSAMLLQRRVGSDGRVSAGMDSAMGTYSRAGSTYTPTIMGGGIANESPRSSVVVSPQPDPYYRPPRQRQRTIDTVGYLGGNRDLQSPDIAEEGGDADEEEEEEEEEEENITDTSAAIPDSASSPPPAAAAYVQATKDDIDDGGGGDDPRQASRKDYAVREVDFYYGVRGPPLSHTGTRKLKTGPTDPTSPVSSATGWVRGLFQGKSRDKGKGFEVVRSSRAAGLGLVDEDTNNEEEPYRDYPDGSHSRQTSGNPLLSRSSYHDDDDSDGGGDEHEGSGSGTIELSNTRNAATREDNNPTNTQQTLSAAGRLPFSTDDGRRISLGSNASHTPPLPSSRHRDLQPSGIGFVPQYRASDNIHVHHEADSFVGSAAEVVEERDHHHHALHHRVD